MVLLSDLRTPKSSEVRHEAVEGAQPNSTSFGWPWDLWSEAAGYTLDAWQRGVLFMDVMRQRGNQYFAHMAERAPNVLNFSAELVLDGRTLPRPVNYGLVEIAPPPGIEIDPEKRPFVVVDPRAGHGPGIGGFKADSEIGVVLGAGHPCYFVGFLPHPVPGQTIDDVVEAEAAFLECVIARHPRAEGKPVVIGNCQAGWQTMMAAATRPELFGPIILAGAPLSYWAGERGRNPMRYSGGLLGGTWLTSLCGDLGGGLFDGVWLVQNFESMNPANTLWSKQYNLYSRIDTEARRYLEFERWWGGHVLLNAEEIQYITDNLFVGNRLSSAELVTRSDTRIDLRNIQSPIIVLCSKGDNITPPAQALGWISDLYDTVDDMRAHGQTIVYSVHETVGHLGIFVSGAVARKEHEEFASNIDFIDVLPPGLYETRITAKGEHDVNLDLVKGDYILQFVSRGTEDIREIVQERADDDRRFAAMARLSDVNKELYCRLAQPLVRAMVSEPVADWMRRMHPLRLQYELAADVNPVMRAFADLAEAARNGRYPVAEDNIFRTLEGAVSKRIETTLRQYGDARDAFVEQLFLAIYGSPLVQALAGIAAGKPARNRPGEDPNHRAFVAKRIRELLEGIAEGGPVEASCRSLIYIRLAAQAADERAFNLLRELRSKHGRVLSLAEFKRMLREQFLMLRVAPDNALAAIPGMLGRASADDIETWARDIRSLVTAGGALPPEAEARLRAIEAIFDAAARKAREAERPVLALEQAAVIAAEAPAAPALDTDKEAEPSPRRRRATVE